MRRTAARTGAAIAAAVTGWLLFTARRSDDSEIGGVFADRARSADYADCFWAPFASAVPIEAIDLAAVQRGDEIERTSRSIVYEDFAPGLVFTVCYELRADADQLAFGTAVRYRNMLGRAYFMLVRPVHRLLAPAIPIVTSRRCRSWNATEQASLRHR